jgi:hypothetical protein
VGGENMMTISNFNPSTTYGTVCPDCDPTPSYDGAFYYIDDVSVTLNTTGLPAISSTNTCLCASTTATLTTTPMTGFSYSWSTGATTSSIEVTPTVTTTYTLTATDENCSISNTVTEYVGAITPTVTITSEIEPEYDASCKDPADLSANAPCATSFNWGISSETGSWTLGSSTTYTDYVTASTYSTDVTVWAESVNTCGTSAQGNVTVYSGTQAECMGNTYVKPDTSKDSTSLQIMPENRYEVYPNPANTEVTIELPSNDIGKGDYFTYMTHLGN